MIPNNGYICKKNENNVFAPVLEREILKMLQLMENVPNAKLCNVIVCQNRETNFNCHVIIVLSEHFLQKTEKFTPPDTKDYRDNDTANMFIGYTFLQNELISCYLYSNSCYEKLINYQKLIPLNDSIQNNFDKFSQNSELFTFDPPMKIYEVVNVDSLKLIKSLNR